jgi:hypothetical protein
MREFQRNKPKGKFGGGFGANRQKGKFSGDSDESSGR